METSTQNFNNTFSDLRQAEYRDQGNVKQEHYPDVSKRAGPFKIT
jgi:hypothetical protein